MLRRPPRSTRKESSAASDVYKRQVHGYAYIEFEEAEAVDKALKLSQSLFKGRQIEVSKKRKTVPGMGRKRGYGMFPRFPRMFMPYGRFRYGM
eukprot:TRINITY_DN957_c0_g1_i8.p1 TRINITY_DN957_c0_g1~~TRINITY_DN957_c0_g1_i8.p1  ORF type:complete len:102 (+),score=44.38 TRINITY_DN957_c0_g1_i8:29-307(+)